MYPDSPVPTVSAHPTPAVLTLIGRVAIAVARKAGLSADDALDFSQQVYLQFAEDDYRAVTAFRGASSLKTYLTTIIRRLLIDQQRADRGRWRPSAAAARLGSVATELERLVYRDGVPVQESISTLHVSTGLTESRLWDLLLALPPRQPKPTEVAEVWLESFELPFLDPVHMHEEARRHRVRRRALRLGLESLPQDERQLLHLRYVSGLSVQAISERLGEAPSSLYRRYDRLLASLRRMLREHPRTCSPHGRPSTPARREAPAELRRPVRVARDTRSAAHRPPA